MLAREFIKLYIKEEYVSKAHLHIRKNRPIGSYMHPLKRDAKIPEEHEIYIEIRN